MFRSFRVVGMLLVLALSGGVVAATTASGPPTVDLSKAAYFLSPTGEEVVLGPGTFEVQATKGGLQLKPTNGKPEDAKVIHAQLVPHPELLEAPKAMAESVGEDMVRVALLLPEETGFEARGSYSGVRSRAVCSTCAAYPTSNLASNSTGAANTAIGYQALVRNQTGSDNTATGASALFNNVGGLGNTAIGANVLNANTASYNTAVGAFSLTANTNGSNNTAVGLNALRYNQGGIKNVAVGSGALTTSFGSNNTATGYLALNGNRNGGANTAFGFQALVSSADTQNNTAVGSEALKNVRSGSFNTAVGAGALKSLSLASETNTAVGMGALFNLSQGNGNIALGYFAGQNQTGGNRNIYVYDKGVAGESATMRIGTQPDQQRTFIAGISGVAVAGTPVVVNAQGQLGVQGSSMRYKDDIRDMAEASRDLQKLRPVTFRYKYELAGKQRAREFGLIAEEVAEVYPELVGRNADGEIVTVKYHELIPMLLNEVQMEHRQVGQLNRWIEEQERQIQALSSRVAELETVVNRVD